MCFDRSLSRELARWNWDGDVIVHDPVVPSHRAVVGKAKAARSGYPIDVRGYLLDAQNGVLGRALDGPIRALAGKGAHHLRSQARRSFDFRAAVIARYMAEEIAYQKPRGVDWWQLPDETLSIRQGDCEDRAFLLASLLLASGVSAYNVRVCLGRVRPVGQGRRPRSFDHMWVVYKTEAGHWIPLEPRHLMASVQYEPFYVFNRDHLWAIRHPDRPASLEAALPLGRRWTKFQPTFDGKEHNSILHQALSPVLPEPERTQVLASLDTHFKLFKNVDEPDFTSGMAGAKPYSPYDHFDNGFIAESWRRVTQRLAAFAADNTDLTSFEWAAHGIADFYAHTSWVHFCPRINLGTDNEAGALYTATNAVVPLYDAAHGFDLASGRFSVDAQWYGGSEAQRRVIWDGKLVSGRWAQPGDRLREDPLERSDMPQEILNLPPAKLAALGALPHHDEIAVDGHARHEEHQLYLDDFNHRSALNYDNQLAWRTNSAVLHVRQAFLGNWKGRTQ